MDIPDAFEPGSHGISICHIAGICGVCGRSGRPFEGHMAGIMASQPESVGNGNWHSLSAPHPGTRPTGQIATFPAFESRSR